MRLSQSRRVTRLPVGRRVGEGEGQVKQGGMLAAASHVSWLALSGNVLSMLYCPGRMDASFWGMLAKMSDASAVATVASN